MIRTECKKHKGWENGPRAGERGRRGSQASLPCVRAPSPSPGRTTSSAGWRCPGSLPLIASFNRHFSPLGQPRGADCSLLRDCLANSGVLRKAPELEPPERTHPGTDSNPRPNKETAAGRKGIPAHRSCYLPFFTSKPE